jgi:hypothetical protein
MAGRSRPKDGVAKLAYVPAMTVGIYRCSAAIRFCRMRL